jgi:hypothetical protein
MTDIPCDWLILLWKSSTAEWAKVSIGQQRQEKEQWRRELVEGEKISCNI